MSSTQFDSGILARLIEVGYEIADCNDEGLTDFDEAVRILQTRGISDADLENVRENYQVYESKFNHEFEGG